MIFNIDDKIKNESGIYLIKNHINSKCYVGSTKNFYQRYVDHKAHLIKNCHPNKILQNFVNKYGIDTLNFNLILLCDESLLKYNEKLMMDMLTPEFNIKEIEITEFSLYNKDIEIDKVCKIIDDILINVDFENCTVDLTEE